MARERSVGESFHVTNKGYGGILCRCVANKARMECDKCVLSLRCHSRNHACFGLCSGKDRSDGRDVHFEAMEPNWKNPHPIRNQNTKAVVGEGFRDIMEGSVGGGHATQRDEGETAETGRVWEGMYGHTEHRGAEGMDSLDGCEGTRGVADVPDGKRQVHDVREPYEAGGMRVSENGKRRIHWEAEVREGHEGMDGGKGVRRFVPCSECVNYRLKDKVGLGKSFGYCLVNTVESPMHGYPINGKILMDVGRDNTCHKSERRK